jgi:hypothetical protein
MDDYLERVSSLMKLFLGNLFKANDLVVEDLPVDYITHRFIFLSFICYIEAERLSDQFTIENLRITISSPEKRDDAYVRELINKFHSLEKELVLQNEALEMLILEPMRTACAPS